MANLSSLAKDTAIYGLSSIIGRFLNYMLVPLYTHYMPTQSGDYGISTNVYAYTVLILVLLTFGMETTLFRYANDEQQHPDTVFSTGFALIASLTRASTSASSSGVTLRPKVKSKRRRSAVMLEPFW